MFVLRRRRRVRPAESVTRVALRRRGIKFTSPERRDHIAYRQRKDCSGGRPPAFDAELYADRNVVERCFYRLNQSLPGRRVS